MNTSAWMQKNRDLLLRALSTLGMVLDLFFPILGIACGVIAMSLTYKGEKSDWKNPDLYYAILTILAGVFIIFAVNNLPLPNSSSSSSASL